MKVFLSIAVVFCITGLLTGGTEGFSSCLKGVVFVIAAIILLGIGFVTVYSIKEKKDSKKK